MIELELSWPPSVNSYKKVGKLTRTKTGKLYQPKVNSPETNRFYFEVWGRILALNAKEGVKFVYSSTISLEVTIDLYPPDNRRRDIDNGIKIIFDSLQRGGLIEDDFQIARLLVTRRDIIPKGKVIVRIQEFSP